MNAEEFTKAFPIGTPVFYYPIKAETVFSACTIRSEAWELGSGHVVVKVTGRTGGVSIEHIKPAPATEKIMSIPPLLSGTQLIAAERQRQITKEGYSEVHDDTWERGELVKAAIAYCMAENKDLIGVERGVTIFTEAYELWPFDGEAWNPKDRESNLIRAGALIAAEIDRLHRLEAGAQVEEKKS